jgi:DNA polymerase bacteriophage-type
MLRMSKPQYKKGEKYYDEDPEHYEILHRYCVQDVRVERRLDKILPDLSPAELDIWFYDQLINERGVKVDLPTVKNILRILESKTKELNAELVKITEGKVTAGTQVPSMMAYLKDTGCDMPNLQKQTVAEFIQSGRLTPKHLKVLRLRQQLGRISTKKYAKLMDSTDKNGVLRDCFVYHGASTGRWAGRLVQLQNLTYDKKGVFDPESVLNDVNTQPPALLDMMYPGRLIEAISASIRGVFVPSPGKEFLVVDYSTIEVRVLMWLAGELQGLEEFKKADLGQDVDIYVKMARRIYGDPTLTKKNSKERALGKATILGSGYGMSGGKFCATCQGQGIEITEEEGNRIINLYRTTYKSIRNYWYDMERAVFLAFNHPGQVSEIGNVKWIYQKGRDRILCQLPSGRVLTYISPKMVQNRFDGDSLSFMTEVTSQWVRKEYYGAMFVENLCQAIARDIMAYSFPKLEKAGFPILLHAHDEVVSERPKGEGRINDMIKIMCDTDPWATGCPIVAEGFYCDRYRKG